MNIKIRLIFLIISFIAVFSGLIIYILFRENTYINDFFSGYLNFIFVCNNPKKNAFVTFLKYYFVDFLWCFSFANILSAFSISKDFRFSLHTIIIPVTLGILFEVAQYCSIISGTGDLCDVVMYVLAGVIHALLNIIIQKVLRRKEKL